MAKLFFSYSHIDESLRDQLEVHLAALKRQGIITSWHDRQIVAGTEWAEAIDLNLEEADVVLLLISPDFIASSYCYEREMMRAMERHRAGAAKVIPVILRPCDWTGLPFGTLQGVPKNAKPITTWANLDEAFLDVVTAIKRALPPQSQPKSSPAAVPFSSGHGSEPVVRSSNLRVRKIFTDLDKDRFSRDGFEFIAKFFEASLQELVHRNPGLEQTFRRIDTDRFTAAAYRDGRKVCRGSASIGHTLMGSSSIAYVMTDEPRGGGMNEAVSAESDEQTVYFKALGMQSHGQRNEKLTFQGAAELFWDLFIQPLQQ